MLASSLRCLCTFCICHLVSRILLRCRLVSSYNTYFVFFHIWDYSSIALTLLVGCQEDHLACKNWVMGCCCGYLSGARCIWSSWCHCHPQTSTSLTSFKSRLVLPFWYWLAPIVLEKRPLIVCSSSSFSVCGIIYDLFKGVVCWISGHSLWRRLRRHTC